MGDFVPGLVEMLEKRFGRAGRPLSTVVLAAACLWIILAGVDRLVNTVITPLVSALQGPFGEELLWLIGTWVATIILAVVMWSVSYYLIAPRLFRRATEQLQRTRESLQKTEENIVTARHLLAQVDRGQKQLTQQRRQVLENVDKAEQLLDQLDAQKNRRA